MKSVIQSITLNMVLLINVLNGTTGAGSSDNLEDLFGNCRISDKANFDECLKFTLNRLNPLFKYGIPEYKVAPFDPHKQSYVEQSRGDRSGLAGYKLVLKDVSEYGWSQSWITKLKMDWENNAIVYTQQFPEKSLDGHYVFESKILGQPLNTAGNWSLVLYDYSQTTTVKRLGGPGERLKVRVEIDKVGDMKLHISDLLGGKVIMESIADFLINNAWQPGFPFIKPLIGDLVSSAFTDIFNESFRYFPIDKFFKY